LKYRRHICSRIRARPRPRDCPEAVKSVVVSKVRRKEKVVLTFFLTRLVELHHGLSRDPILVTGLASLESLV